MTIGSVVATSNLDMDSNLNDYDSFDSINSLEYSSLSTNSYLKDDSDLKESYNSESENCNLIEDSNFIANSNENYIRMENNVNQALSEENSNQYELNLYMSNSNVPDYNDVVDSNDDEMVFTDLLESNGLATVVIYDESYYNYDNSLIQEIIDNAVSGSTIQFTGSSYKNLCLNINKPLNIISNSGTLITNTINSPVFTILEGGSGTNISGFVIKTEGSFVDASNVFNINIKNNTISTKKDAIIFNKVFDSNIERNKFLDFLTAIELKKSGGIKISKNDIRSGKNSYAGIYLEDIPGTKPISITENNMVGYGIYDYKIAIYVGKDVSNVLIAKNNITKWYQGIVFDYSPNNFTIYNNTISDNRDGVIVTGQAKNFIFRKNIVTGNVGKGFFFDEDFYGTKGTFSVENNYFSYNSIDFKNKGADYVTVGRNFAYNSCPRVYLKYILKVSTKKSGNNYIFTVTDIRNNAITDLPSFTATVTVNGKRYTVTFKDGMGYLNGDGIGDGSSISGSSMSLDIGQDDRILSEWGGVFSEISLEEMQKLIDAYNGVNKDNSYGNSSSGSNQNSQFTNSSSSNSGSGSGDSGSSSGQYSINADSSASASASSAGSSSDSPSASASASSSAPTAPSESASVKTLSVDDETFRVIGAGGLIFLIMLVIGLYYREDIKDMMEDN